MSEQTQARIRAAAVALAPVVFLIGILTLPYLSDRTDTAATASKVAEDGMRSAWGIILLVASVVLTLLAVFSLRRHIEAAGERTWSFVAVPLIVAGGVGLAFMAGVYLAAVPLAAGGGDVVAYFEDAKAWIMPINIVAAGLFGLGWLSLAAAILRARVLVPERARVVALALVVLAVAQFLPWGWGLYLSGIALLVGLWPLAYELWAQTGNQPMRQARHPSPA